MLKNSLVRSAVCIIMPLRTSFKKTSSCMNDLSLFTVGTTGTPSTIIILRKICFETDVHPIPFSVFSVIAHLHRQDYLLYHHFLRLHLVHLLLMNLRVMCLQKSRIDISWIWSIFSGSSNRFFWLILEMRKFYWHPTVLMKFYVHW